MYMEPKKRRFGRWFFLFKRVMFKIPAVSFQGCIAFSCLYQSTCGRPKSQEVRRKFKIPDVRISRWMGGPPFPQMLTENYGLLVGDAIHFRKLSKKNQGMRLLSKCSLSCKCIWGDLFVLQIPFYQYII